MWLLLGIEIFRYRTKYLFVLRLAAFAPLRMSDKKLSIFALTTDRASAYIRPIGAGHRVTPR